MNPKFFRNGIVMLALVVVALAVAITLVGQSTPPNNKAYSEFLNDVKGGAVTEITQEGSKLTVKEKDGTTYTVVVPGLLAQAYADVEIAAKAGGIATPKFTATQAPDTSWLGIIITGLLPILIIGGFIFFMMRQAQGTNNQALRRSTWTLARRLT